MGLNQKNNIILEYVVFTECHGEGVYVVYDAVNVTYEI